MSTEPYIPGQALVGEATPQSDPDLFSAAEILAEMKYLLRLNKRYGTHVLRVIAYNKLAAELADRCEGHESLNGADMSREVSCDGTCRND